MIPLEAYGNIRYYYGTGLIMDIAEKTPIPHRLNLLNALSSNRLCYCGTDRTFQFANEAYAETLKLRPDQIIGRSLVDVLGPDAYATILPYIETVLKG